MELSAELFKQTLAALKSERFGGGKENRKSPRVQIRSKIRIFIRSGDDTLLSKVVWVQDISQGGLCVQYNEILNPETLFVVQLPSLQSAPLTMLCTARNSRTIRMGLWAIGSTFTEVLAGTPDTLLPQKIIKPRPTASKPAMAPILLSDDSVAYADELPPDDDLVKRIQAAMFD